MTIRAIPREGAGLLLLLLEQQLPPGGRRTPVLGGTIVLVVVESRGGTHSQGEFRALVRVVGAARESLLYLRQIFLLLPFV